MNILYGLLIVMLVVAIGIVSVPFVANHSVRSRAFLLVSVFICVFSVSIYAVFSNQKALRQWINVGQKHYRLVVEFNQLGGLNGVINRITAKLMENPNDVEGWFILGKLYFANHENEKALAAFTKAHQLRPEDKTIAEYYNALKNNNTNPP